MPPASRPARAAPLATLALLSLAASGAGAACSACGKSVVGTGSENGASTSPTAIVNRTTLAPEAGPAAARDVTIWTSARGGTPEDLAALATHEGAAGLIEAAAEPELRMTALRAMGYAAGWAQLPFLAGVASANEDDQARVALDSVVQIAARPRRAEDVEDVDELREGCQKLAALARDATRSKDRRVPALRALRMMPCPKQDLPTDLDAR